MYVCIYIYIYTKNLRLNTKVVHRNNNTQIELSHHP